MKELFIKTDVKYKVLIEKGILTNAANEIKKASSAKKIAIITDTNVGMIYAKNLVNPLIDSGFEVSVFTFKAGESSKNLNIVQEIYMHLSSNFISRGDLIISLGGGVCSDIAGFVAATYLRGIDYVNIPTSFLAQIDSSIGGKVAVNLSCGKNLVGSFYSPKLVIIDPEVLSTLPKRYFIDGMAEAIKYGAIKDQKIFNFIKTQKIMADNIENLIYSCLCVKKSLVEIDQFDKGSRMLLNFGHTFGHAIEKFYDYKKFSHGEAVAIGMALITKCAAEARITPFSCYDELISLLKQYNLPFESNISNDDLYKFCLSDKKFYSNNEFNMVLLTDTGKAFIKTMSREQFLKFIIGGKI